MELEGGGARGKKRNGSRVAVAARRGRGDFRVSTRSVFLDDDDALWDFMECVLKAAEMTRKRERERERERRRRRGGKRRLSRSVSEASRLDIFGSRTDSSAVFVKLLAWDVDTLEATLREDAAATVLGYIGLARQFAHEWPARDAEKLLRFCEAFASESSTRKQPDAQTKTRRGSSAGGARRRVPRRAGGVRAGPLRAAIAAARERLEG